MHPLQEKFQTILVGKEEAGEGWATADSARDRRTNYENECLNDLPPGMDISHQENSQQLSMPLSMSGATDVTPTKPKHFAEGFVKLDMKGTDDCYTGEHVDHFYGDAGGFCERNNYLDRM
jgi:hypothetical protein